MVYGDIVWQPKALYQKSGDFKIILSKTFASDMLEAKVSDEIKLKFNKIGGGILSKMGFNSYEPFYFHEDSLLVTQFNLGSYGRWLGLDLREDLIEKGFLESGNKTLRYFSNNIDYIYEREALLSLVDFWAEHCFILR